ncbi:MAG: glycosyltransferase family 9 protein [Bacteroidota bacterium]
MISNPKHIIISRTDAIGDVVLTLPLAYYLKQKFPSVKITWIGRTYTHSVIEACSYVDNFLNIDQFDLEKKEAFVNALAKLNADAIIHVYPNSKIARAAKQAKIPIRIGTSHRLFHWFTCNQLVNLGRKNSNFHEAQLNIALAKKFNLQVPTMEELKKLPPLLNNITAFEYDFLAIEKKKIIFHPKSRGSGKEWPIENYISLLSLLDSEKYQVLICGTAEEGKRMEKELAQLPKKVLNLVGKLSLTEYLSLISQCDGLVASGTGPLHLAASIGVNALGLFPPTRPIHPGRWQPIGRKADYLVIANECATCKQQKQPCDCMLAITPEQVAQKVSQW